MNETIEFDVKAVTEMHNNKNPVYQGQEVLLLFQMFDEDNKILDLSGVGVTNEIILKPVNRAKKTFTATFVTDGTDGKVKYTTVAADLDRTGVWKAQLIHTKDTGQIVPSSIVTFTVLPRL